MAPVPAGDIAKAQYTSAQNTLRADQLREHQYHESRKSLISDISKVFEVTERKLHGLFYVPLLNRQERPMEWTNGVLFEAKPTEDTLIVNGAERRVEDIARDLKIEGPVYLLKILGNEKFIVPNTICAFIDGPKGEKIFRIFDIFDANEPVGEQNTLFSARRKDFTPVGDMQVVVNDILQNDWENNTFSISTYIPEAILSGCDSQRFNQTSALYKRGFECQLVDDVYNARIDESMRLLRYFLNFPTQRKMQSAKAVN